MSGSSEYKEKWTVSILKPACYETSTFQASYFTSALEYCVNLASPDQFSNLEIF